MGGTADARAFVYGLAAAAVVASLLCCPAADARLSAKPAHRLAQELTVHAADVPQLPDASRVSVNGSVARSLRCLGLPPSRPLASVYGKVFEPSGSRGAPFLSSNVAIWRRAGVARHVLAAFKGPAGRRCERSVARRFFRATHYRPDGVSVQKLRSPAPGGAWLRLKVGAVVAGMHTTSFSDGLLFARDGALIELSGTSASRPFAPWLLRRTERILVARARRLL